MQTAAPPPRTGIGANLPQFLLLVAVNALVGTLVGQERTLVPLLGREVFHVGSATVALTFIATFGVAKALANLAAGALADRVGRRRVLVAGWLAGVPVPLLLMAAPSWAWVVGANLLLGINQGLTWSTTVVMKIDLAGPRRRGLAMGLNESAGYLAVALSAWTSGLVAARTGLRPEPFLIGLAAAALGLGLSAAAVRETRGHAGLEAGHGPTPRLRTVLAAASWRHRGLAAASRTGLASNLNDALAWGLLPLLLAAEGMSSRTIGLVAAVYPAVWGAGQLATGPLADRIGRRLPAAAGMWVQAAALAWFWLGQGLPARVGASALLGAGTALAYPALLAAVGDLAGPSWRAGALGAYRLWRDAGFVAGALGAGIAADLVGLRGAVALVAAVTALAGWDAWRHLPGWRSTIQADT